MVSCILINIMSGNALVPDRRQAAWTIPALLLIELVPTNIKEIEIKSFN